MCCPALEETDLEPSFVSCIRCGACASMCSNDALKVEQYEVSINGEPVIRDRIAFNPSKCDQCGDCIEACPYDMIHKTDNPKLKHVLKTHYVTNRCVNTPYFFLFLKN